MNAKQEAANIFKSHTGVNLVESEIMFSGDYKYTKHVHFGGGEPAAGTIYKTSGGLVVFDTDRGYEFTAQDLIAIATKMIEMSN